MRAIPGVTRAGIISRLPFDVWTHPFTIVGRPAPKLARSRSADLNEVDAQALDTLGIRLLRGRMIQEQDTASTPWVAVINKTFADRHFPGQDPVGQAIRISVGPAGDGAVTEPQPRQIVGVVADVTYPSFSTEKPAAVYVPFRQHLSQYGREDEWIHTRKVAGGADLGRSAHARPPDSGRARARRSRSGGARLHDDGCARARRRRRSPTAASLRRCSRTFGTLAILLAMVGVYGVMSWVVGQRTTEFGIRMALGARALDVVAMLMTQSLKPIGIGIVIGVLGGFGLSRGAQRHVLAHDLGRSARDSAASRR